MTCNFCLSSSFMFLLLHSHLSSSFIFHLSSSSVTFAPFWKLSIFISSQRQQQEVPLFGRNNAPVFWSFYIWPHSRPVCMMCLMLEVVQNRQSWNYSHSLCNDVVMSSSLLGRNEELDFTFACVTFDKNSFFFWRE